MAYLRVTRMYFDEPPDPSGGVLKRWNGSSWVAGLLKTYLGGSWQGAILKRWTGSEWLTVDAG